MFNIAASQDQDIQLKAISKPSRKLAMIELVLPEFKCKRPNHSVIEPSVFY